MKITRLSPLLANQIAAGEVIERPASVVKELLENALDSGATRIQIDVLHGGLQMIRVTDNGCGIERDELHLAVMAHATSKISQLDDLFAIESMGFRGEALASITSVSEFSLSSKSQHAEQAFCLKVAGSQAPSIEPCAHPQGTTVEVRELFFNTPVRRKFLKSARSEFLAIDKVVRRFALSACYMSIELTHDGKRALHCVPGDDALGQLKRVSKLLGKAFMECARPLEVEHGEYQLSGWVSAPSFMRSQNDKQYCYVNQRMVRDKLINHAIKQAYEEYLYPGRFPAFVLYFNLPAADIDVNVHPTKHEVRFKQARLVHDFLVSHIKGVLAPPALEQDILPTSSVRQESPPHTVGRELFAQTNSFQFQAPSAPQGDWHPIGTSHALMSIDNQEVLFNAKEMHGQVVSQQLHAEPIARPVLVPLRLSVDEVQKKRILPILDDLKALGLELSFIDEFSVVVRSLPAVLGQLDFEQLLARLGELPVGLTRQELIDALCEATPFDWNTLESGERAAIIARLKEALSHSPERRGCYKVIHQNDVERILHA